MIHLNQFDVDFIIVIEVSRIAGNLDNGGLMRARDSSTELEGGVSNNYEN